MAHNSRMNDIAKAALAPPGTPLRLLQERYLSAHSTEAQKKEIETRYRIAIATITAQMDNSSGLGSSEILRSLLFEINDRLFKHGLWHMPASFNVFEAFVKYLPDYNYFRLHQEFNNELYFSDYFDYVTSSSDDSIDSISDTILDKTIYSFDSLDNNYDLVFTISSEVSFTFKSFSFIKDDDEVAICATIGLRDTAYSINLSEAKIEYTKDGIRPSPEREEKRIFEFDDYQKSIVLFRLNLKDRKQDTRYLLKDEGNQYYLLTDDPSTFINTNGTLEEKYKAILKHGSEELQRLNEIYELSVCLLGLGKYCEINEDNSQIRKVATEFRKNFKSEKYQKLVKSADSDMKLFFRNINMFEKKVEKTSGQYRIINQIFNIEREGYWKRLAPGEEGKDRNGNNTFGKTWVSESRYFYVSQPLEHENDAVINDERTGYLYIMRNASHAKNIFKIGVTKRNTDIRAAELSSTTSSPDHFLIAQEWFVKDCYLAEKLAHEHFESKRINDRREYFRVDFRELINIIDEIVEQINVVDKGRT